MDSSRRKGILMVIIGSCMWGVSGCAGQYLLQRCELSAEFLVATRLLLAGLILLTFDYVQARENIFSIFTCAKDLRSLLIFSIFGMLAVQYTYFAAIGYSNAAAVTVIQYLMPIFILIYTAISQRRLPKRRELLCVALAFVGTFILVTHFSLDTLSIPARAAIIALISAVVAAFYTIYPKRLLMRWRSPLIIGWSMFLGGLTLSLYCPPWPLEGIWDLKALCLYAYIIIFGTVVPFTLYLASTKYIPATETGVLASCEPLSAILFSTLFLAVPFGFFDLLGSGLIIMTVVILTRHH